jgi:hypothetical protein
LVELSEFEGGYVDLSRIREYAAGVSLVDLELKELLVQSFFGRLSLNPMTTQGRRRILAIAGIATLLLIPVLGPIPNMVIDGLILAHQALTPDDAPPPPPTPLKSVNVDRIESVGGEASIRLSKVDDRAA